MIQTAYRYSTEKD